MPIYVKFRRTGFWRAYVGSKVEALITLIYNLVKSYNFGKRVTVEVYLIDEEKGEWKPLFKETSLNGLFARKDTIRKTIEGLNFFDLLKISLHIDFPLSEYPAYATLYYAPELKRVYGDIELGIYATDECETILDVYKGKVKDLAIALNDFKSDISNLVAINVNKIVVGKDPDSFIFIDEPSIYRGYSRGREFIKDILSTLSVKEEKYSSLLGPYRKEFIASIFWKIPHFREDIVRMCRKYNITISLRSYVVYSNDAEAIPRMYQEVSKQYFEQLFKELDDKKKIERKIKKIVLKTKDLVQ